MLNYISICSGIEAATVAFHPIGWRPLAFAEIEAFPSAVLDHHYPTTPNLGDMTRFREWPEELLSECDLLVGGPPCVAFSVAGLRNSLSDARGNLTLTYVQLIDHIDTIRRKHGRPPILSLFENVPGIYSTKDNAFGCLVGAICGQDAPVETETGKWPTSGIFWGTKRRVGYRTLDAQYFGLAQRRRRCFLLAVPNELVEHLGDRACPSEILSIPESLRGDTPPSREKRTSVAALTANGVGTCGADDNQGQAGHLIASTLRARDQSRGVDSDCTDTLITHSLRAEGFDASEDGTGRGTPLVPVAFQTRGSNIDANGVISGTLGCNADRASGGAPCIAFHPTQDPISSTDGTTHAMGCGSKGGQASVAVAFSCKDSGADAGEIAPTLRAMGHSGSHANAGGQVALAYRVHGEHSTAMTGGGDARVADPVEVARCLDTCGGYSTNQGGNVVLQEPFTLAIRGRGDSHHLEYRRDGVANALLTPNGGRAGIGVGAVAIPINMQAAAKNGVKSPNMLGVGDDGEPFPTLGANDIHAVAFAQNTRDEVRLIGGDGQIGGALAAQPGMKQQSYVAGPMAVRRITPTEAERLMGVPDGYTNVPYRGKPAADGPRYRGLGNSFAVPCVRWIGQRIQMALEMAA
jgi:DNA (cytosine-5)-methyltransferase 1